MLCGRATATSARFGVQRSLAIRLGAAGARCSSSLSGNDVYSGAAQITALPEVQEAEDAIASGRYGQADSLLHRALEVFSNMPPEGARSPMARACRRRFVPSDPLPTARPHT